jgi:hypothetical protein
VEDTAVTIFSVFGFGVLALTGVADFSQLLTQCRSVIGEASLEAASCL